MSIFAGYNIIKTETFIIEDDDKEVKVYAATFENLATVFCQSDRKLYYRRPNSKYNINVTDISSHLTYDEMCIIIEAVDRINNEFFTSFEAPMWLLRKSYHQMYDNNNWDCDLHPAFFGASVLDELIDWAEWLNIDPLSTAPAILKGNYYEDCVWVWEQNLMHACVKQAAVDELNINVAQLEGLTKILHSFVNRGGEESVMRIVNAFLDAHDDGRIAFGNAEYHPSMLDVCDRII